LALNTRGSVDPRWTTHNRGVLRALQLATVEIFNQASTTKVYDPVTNTWTGNDTTLYTGPARVQQLNTVSETSDNYNPTFLKTVRVQIAASAVDIRPNDRMRVTACATNEALTKFTYVVTDVLNSSNAWEKTILCKVDTELDPTAV
jgi:hypothetical protein